jgi:hypothetical protein
MLISARGSASRQYVIFADKTRSTCHVGPFIPPPLRLNQGFFCQQGFDDLCGKRALDSSNDAAESLHLGTINC